MMDLLNQTELVVARLKKEKLKFALAGGLASSIYRKSKRTTDDLDFLLSSEANSEESARQILKDFGLKITEAHKSDLENDTRHKKSSPLYILIGRHEGSVGIDFILPSMPWFQKALERAQENILKFGSLDLPCLTAEDIIIAKFYSLYNDSTRFSDADDIKTIFADNPDLDLGYIVSQMQLLGITVPLAVEKVVPPILLKTSKKMKKKFLKR
jgi:hypothetical protein